MHPAIAGLIAMATLCAGTWLGFLIRARRSRAEEDRLAAEQRSSVQLFLRRKVAETGVDIGDQSMGSTCRDVLASNARMARALLDHERRTIETGDTQELSLASTVRLQSTDAGPRLADTLDQPARTASTTGALPHPGEKAETRRRDKP